MDLRDVTLRIYECSAPAAALRAMAPPLAGPLGVRRAVWVGPNARVEHAWPEGARVSHALASEALRATEPAVLPLGARFPLETAENPDAEALLLPLETSGEPLGAVVVLGRAGCLGADPAAWREPALALARVAERERELRQTREERDTLRQRAEESEALHVLGLAANRTLDPDEVLTLVARFTRTLLGAHYVTVNTLAEGRIRTVAAVGLRHEGDADDPFAARVAAARKPLTLSTDGETGLVSEPFHAAEGMRVGLGVPLSLFGETFGALVIGYRRPYTLAPRDTRLALTLAGHAAVAISNARLHGTLAQRSAELERANEELRWTTEAKDRFFASVSHELRTPLNAILGYQTLLLDGVTGDLPLSVRPFLERAHRSTQNLLHLVNDVLDLSKLDAGKMELIIQPVRLRGIVEEAIATVEPMAVGKGIDVEVAPAPPIPNMATDADRVRQILINLLSNAVKFTDEGRVAVSVTMDGAMDGGGGASRWLELHVSDTGQGIAPENHERIFHEFEQILGATSRGGTGLGLPISRKLARLLGGDILVDSRLGEGARFTLRLPLVPA